MKATGQIFLSYAREDAEKVENLYQKLSDAGFKPWMDKKDIVPGESWKSSIQGAIQRSDFFLVCLSANSVSKRGFIRKEIEYALDIWQEELDRDIYLIPVRLEDCEVPESLRDFQWANLFEEYGWARLVEAIKVGMERRHIKTLADLMRQRKTAGEPPYVLFLGAGASLASGAPTTSEIVDDIVRTLGDRSPETMSAGEKVDAFYTILDGLSDAERYTVLRKYLSRAAPSAGYQHLAALVKAGYFDTLFTTSFDTFLEDSLADAGLRTRRDFVVVIVGRDSEQLIQAAVGRLGREGPQIKIIKLHGDLSSRVFALTSSEVLEFSEQTRSLLKDYLSRDVVIVGYTMRDEDINRCVSKRGGTLWYVNPSSPSADDFMHRILSVREGGVITGEYGSFDKFFGELADSLLYRPEEVAFTREVAIADDLVTSGSVIVTGDVSGTVWIGKPSRIVERRPRDERLERIDSLTRQLEVLRSNLNRLETQAAMYGTSPPLHLMNQIEEIEMEIERLATEIEQLKRETR